MQNYRSFLFPTIIFISAISVSLSAAYYSVFGMSKLFSGHQTAAFILFSSLEFAKLIIAGALHQYWKSINKGLRIYLCIAVGVLIVFTSGGIYGFLSDAYQQTADKDRYVQTRIELLKKKQGYFQTQLDDSKLEKTSVSNSIQDLRKSLSTDNQYQSIDRRTGQVLTQIQTTSKKGIQTQLDNAISKNDKLETRILGLQDSISSYDLRIIETEQNSDVASELGPLKYLSNLTGKPMDQIVNWFLILLMIVFDPLAIALVLLALFTFNLVKKPIEKEETSKPKRKRPSKPDVPAKEHHSQDSEDLLSLGTEEQKTFETEFIEIPEAEIKVPDRPVQIIEKPKRTRKPRTKKFNILDEIPEVAEIPIAVEDEEISIIPIEVENKSKKERKTKTRKVVDTNLTPDIGKHLSESLNKKKVKS